MRARSAIVQKHGQVDGREGPYIVAHCVSGLFSGFVGYENCWRNAESCRMGFHRLSLLLYHAGDWRIEECFGSRRCTSYPEKQRSQCCVKIYRLPCKSLWSIVYGRAVNFYSGNRIVLWAHLFIGLLNWPLCNTTDGHSMRALASKSFQRAYAWSPRTLRFNTSAAPTQTYVPGNLHNIQPVIFSGLTLCQCDEDVQVCAVLEWLLCLWLAFCVVLEML